MSDPTPRKVPGEKQYYKEWDVPLFNGYALVACWGTEGWLRFNKDMGNPYPIRGDDLFGVSMQMHNGPFGKTAIFMDIRGHLEGTDSPMAQLVATLAHETSHFCDHVFEHVSEKDPCGETRAYLTEWAYLKLFTFFMARGDWPLEKPKPRVKGAPKK